MTVLRILTYTALCDACGDTCDVSGNTLTEAVRQATKVGWKITGSTNDRALCKACKAAQRKAEVPK